MTPGPGELETRPLLVPVAIAIDMSTTKNVNRAKRLLTAGASLCVVWVLIAGADPATWVLGAPAIAIALAAIAVLPPAAAPAPRWGALARLVGFFLIETLRGAVDVGLRTLAREPVTRARVELWHMRLNTPAARLILVHGISLIPGTLTARVEDDVLKVHVLDDRLPWREGIAALETRIAATFEPDRVAGT